MTKEEFDEIFEEFRVGYKNSKDSGWDELHAIVLYIKNLDFLEQTDFIKYCVNEIKKENNLDWYLNIIAKLQNPVAIDLLYDIFIMSNEPDSVNIKNILGTLFELKDDNEKHLYRYEIYIDTFIKAEYNFDNFFLILKYLNIHPDKSVNILTTYFNIMFSDVRYVNSKENLITFLAYCEQTSFEYLYLLMNTIKEKYPILKLKLNEILEELYSSDRLYYNTRIRIQIKKYLDKLDSKNW